VLTGFHVRSVGSNGSGPVGPNRADSADETSRPRARASVAERAIRPRR
jgi:hypothetical protein